MPKFVITDNLREELFKYLKKNRKADLITTYLFFLEKKHHLKPVLFPKEKKIYQGLDELIQKLEEGGKLWRETEIKIQFGKESVNEETKKIYICPFTGKVFGDNTHPNPQDAIYDWVSSCPQNKEKSGGLPSKRFFVSEDPEVIKNYIVKRKAPISKTVYSSAVTGKLFNSKKAVMDDFTSNHVKSLSLIEVPSQNRFQIEEGFLAFIQEQLEESKLSAFVEALSQFEEFSPFVSQWQEEDREVAGDES